MGRRTTGIALLFALVSACGGDRECDCERDCQSAAAAVTTTTTTTGSEQPQAPAPEQPAAPRVAAGTCDAGWLPDGTRRDLSDEEAAALVTAVRQWIAEEGWGVVESSNGIVFAKSEDARGDEPPYPPEASALAARACGLGSSWLVDHLRTRLAIPAGPDGEGVTCDENVCCARGMEFVPNTTVVFRRDSERDVWEVETVLLLNEALLGEETVAQNRQHATDAIQRFGQRSCDGEPWLVR